MAAMTATTTNHLLDPIRCLLEGAAGPMSEYQLIQQLQSQGWLEPLDSSDNLALYGVHFLVYNALYQLHQEYLQQGKYLQISALAIALVRLNADSAEQHISADSQTDLEELAAYYLDWSQLEQATQESVECLLQSFWQRYVQADDYLQALTVLGLSPGAPYQEAQRCYRQLAMQHHPDRGGNNSDFQQIQQAFALIKQHHGQ